MVTQQSTSIYCRCSECGMPIRKRKMNLFSLSGEGLHIKCKNCGGSELVIQLSHHRTNSVNIIAPCIFCHDFHRYTVSVSAFFERPVFKFPCALSGFDACIIGSDTRLFNEAVAASESEIEQLVESAGDSEDDDCLSSDEIARIGGNIKRLEEAIRGFFEQRKITCNCKNPKKNPEIKLSLEGSTVEICCRNCFAVCNIDASDDAITESFINGDGIILE